MTSVAGAGCKCLLGNAEQLYHQDSSPTISLCLVVVCMFSFTHRSMDMRHYVNLFCHFFFKLDLPASAFLTSNR